MKGIKIKETRKLKDALVRARTHAERLDDEKLQTAISSLLEKVRNNLDVLVAS